MENHTGHMSKTNDSSAAIKWLGICLGVVALILIAVNVFNVSMSNIFFAGAILACPLMHIFMMRDGGHKH